MSKEEITVHLSEESWLLIERAIICYDILVKRQKIDALDQEDEYALENAEKEERLMKEVRATIRKDALGLSQ